MRVAKPGPILRGLAVVLGAAVVVASVAFLRDMNPVSRRAAGVIFDNRTARPGGRIAAIRAPTLIVHAADDTLQLFHNAEFAAATIPGARLLRFAVGGHLVRVHRAGGHPPGTAQAHPRSRPRRPVTLAGGECQAPTR